jgi:hypothetical protein
MPESISTGAFSSSSFCWAIGTGGAGGSLGDFFDSPSPPFAVRPPRVI